MVASCPGIFPLNVPVPLNWPMGTDVPLKLYSDGVVLESSLLQEYPLTAFFSSRSGCSTL